MPQSNPVHGAAPSPDVHRDWWRERSWPLISSSLALSFVATILWLNALDVRLGWARVFYGAVACWLLGFFALRSFRIWRFVKAARNDANFAHGLHRVHRILEVCLFAVLWLLVLESAARALPPLSNSSVNYPGHRFVWPERHAARNSYGLNDVEPGLKGEGPRILVLGDSYVEGAGVKRQERFCSRLQSLLSKSDPQTQVIAAGVGGWNTIHEANFLERHGQQLDPDVVVIAYVLNDVEGDGQLTDQPTSWELWLQTRLQSYLCYRVFRWRRSGFTEYWQRVRQLHAPDSESWKGVEDSLRRIVTWCHRENIPCQLAVLPVFTSDAATVRDVMDQVVSRANRLGITAYSLLDNFGGQWLDFAVSPHDAHPNVLGHERIAQRISQEVQHQRGGTAEK